MTNKLEGKIPTLQTERLVLRPYTLADAPRVQELAGEAVFADATLSIPHPYEDGMAEEWINARSVNLIDEKEATVAITLSDSGELIGSMGMKLNLTHSRADFGYWIGLPYWNKGYCTEALRVLFNFGFEQLGLERMTSHHFSPNKASGRVMEKAGMKHEGTFRKHFRNNGVLEDIELYGILKEEWKPIQ